MEIQTAIHTAQLILQAWSDRFETPAFNRLDVYLADAKDLVTAVVGLRVKRLGYLTAITGLDPGAEEPTLEILYHFCEGPVIVTIRVTVPKDNPEIASLREVIPSAEQQERELQEMFGVRVLGLRNSKHLYLPEDWDNAVFPLRKDFVWPTPSGEMVKSNEP